MDRAQAGFSLVEVLVSSAIAGIVIFTLLAGAHAVVGAAQRMNRRVDGIAGAERLEERLAAEAASAWAIVVPAVDVLGSSNADGHELDFYAEDGAHRTYAWAYRYDSNARTVVRYAVVPGGAPSPGETVGAIDGFSAIAGNASSLVSPQSAFYDPLFAGATVTDVRFSFSSMPGAVGGNGIVRVHVSADGVDNDATLASVTAPTAFTIVIPYTPSPQPTPTSTPAPIPTW